MEKKNKKAVMLLATLKASPTLSHTYTLCQLLAQEFKPHNISSDIIRLVDYTIHPGIESHTTQKDDWPEILEKVLAADVVIFATPVWWGNHSSLLQRVIERMDALNDELLETGISPFASKIGGIVITGAEDGAQNIIGNICNFMIWNGLTIPPAASLSYLGSPGENKEEVEKTFQSEPYISMAKTMARNIAHASRILTGEPYPIKEGGIDQDIRDHSVGMKK